MSHSNSQSIQVNGTDLIGDLTASVTSNFEVSLDDTNFSNQVTIGREDANSGNVAIYVRFSPDEQAIGTIQGVLTLQSSQATTVTLALSGEGVSIFPTVTASLTNFDFDILLNY